MNTIQIPFWPFGQLYAHSVPHHLNAIENISEALECEVSPDDLWGFVRQFNDLPHLGNAYCCLLFQNIETVLNEKYPTIEVDYYVNGFDTHLYLNKEEIHDEEVFWDIVNDTIH